MLGANGCWEILWSEEYLVASLTATPRSSVRSGAKRIPVLWAPSTLHRLQYGMLILSVHLYCCDYSNTSFDPVTFWEPTRSLPYSRNGVLSGRAVYANSCIATGVYSGRVVSLMIARSPEYPKSGLNCYTAVNYHHSVSLVSCAIRVLSKSTYISITYTYS